MQVFDLSLSGLKLIVPCVFNDDRGFFFESYQKDRYVGCGIDESFVQDNFSLSKKGTIRALHFDLRQAKLVSCIEGKVWDVAVDIRPGSPTFMRWEAVELDDENQKQLYIPKGFAHGFCVLSDRAKVQYKVSANYNPQTEYSIRWNDPDLNIEWPIKTPLLSPRDQISPFLKEVVDALDHRG